MPVTVGQLKGLEVESTSAYLRGLQSITPPVFQRIAQQITMSTKTVEAPIIGMVGPLREWIGPRLIERLSIDAYSITAKKYEKTVAVPRETIEDDNVGLYMPQIETLGRQVEAWPDQQVFAKLAAGFTDKCYDGKPFFSATHPDGKGGVYSNQDVSAGAPGTAATWYLFDTTKGIMPLIWALRTRPEFATFWDAKDPNVFWHDEYISGVRARGVADYGFPMFAYAVRTGLNAQSFENAVVNMGKLTNAHGENLGVSPNLAIIPSSLKPAADRLWGSELTVEYAGNGAPGANIGYGVVRNVNFKGIEYVVANRLTNVADTTVAV